MANPPPARPRTRRAEPEGGPSALSPAIRRVLGPSPLTHLEKQDDYEEFLQRVAAAIAPADIVEWIWVKDIVDLTWEVNRARRAQAVVVALARREAVTKVLYAIAGTASGFSSPFDDLVPGQVSRIIVGDEGADAILDSSMRRLNIAEHTVEDVAYTLRLQDIERLQRIADNASARRDAVFREIERRREDVARRLRHEAEAQDRIIDAEFEPAAEPGSAD